MGPRKELVVVQVAGKGTGLERVIVDTEKVHAAAVKAGAEVGHIIGRQLAGGVKADFVEHTAEINQPADFDVRTAETGNVGHKGLSRAGAPTGELKIRRAHQRRQ